MSTKVKQAAAKNGKTTNRLPEDLTASNGNGKAAASKASTLLVPPLKRMHITMMLVSTSVMIQHRWSEKAKLAMRKKHAGEKTKNREVRDTKQEGIDATHLTKEGKYGFPAGALKKSVLTAAHKDLGVARTMVTKSMFVLCSDPGNIIEMECDEPVIIEDTVTVGNNSTDLRYRPYFYHWRAPVTFEIDSEWLTPQDLVNLVTRAGFGVGLLEWRPEKGGECGRFEIDETVPIAIKEIKGGGAKFE